MAFEASTQKVYVRPSWDQPWELVPHLFCDRFTVCASPQIPEAVLYWNYGEILPFGGENYTTRAAQQILDHYVRIEVDHHDAGPLQVWHGVITQEIDNRRGGTTPSGIQIFHAYGLEYFLERTTIETSWTLAPDLTSREIKRAIGFNLGGGDDDARFVPNMSGVRDISSAFAFCDQLSFAQPWTADAIVDYLLTYLSPKDFDGNAALRFAIDPNYADQLRSISRWKPQLQVHGRTLKEALDAILNRHRLMSYRLVVAADDTILLQPFTFAEADIDLPSGERIRANEHLVTYNFDSERRVHNPVITSSTQAMYDQVVARGMPIGVCWTVRQDESTLEADWPTDAGSPQELYNQGSPTAASESDATQKCRLHQNYRNTDAFRQVYRYYRVPPTWDGAAGDPGPFSETRTSVIIPPWASAEYLQDVVALDSFWLPGLRFESHLPLLVGVDYATVSAGMNYLASDLALDYRRPFVTAQRSKESEADAGTVRRFYLDRPETGMVYADRPEGPRQWAVRVLPQQHGLGVILDVSGAPQHVIAKDEFTPADDADAAEYEPELRWQDFTATVFMRLQSFCEGAYPRSEHLTGDRDVLRKLTLEVPGKELLYLVPGTVIEIDAAGALVTSSGGFIKDDREELEAIARLTYQWYATPRRALEVPMRSARCDFEIGQLITTIGSGPTEKKINSVVTQIDYDLRNNSHTLRTQFAELDARGLA